MTSTPDDQTPDEPKDPMLAWLPVLEKYAPEIESACRKIGLYVMDAGLAPHPRQSPFGDAQPPVIVVNFTIGDIAWSDRVQNPIEGRMDAEFKQIENQMSKQTFEELREKMQKALSEGKDPLANDADDTDRPADLGD